MEEKIEVSDPKPKNNKNIMGIISLILSGVGLVGCWIPILNLISIVLAAAGIVLGTISIIMICLKKTGMIVLPILGVALGALTITLGTIVNGAVLNESKKYITNVIQSSSTTSTQDASKKDDQSSSGGVTAQKTGSQDSSKSETTQNKVFNVGDIISWDGKEIVVTNVDRNYQAKYSKPKSGKEFIKVTVSVTNKSDKDMLVSPMKFKIQDSTGAKDTLESCTYSLTDTFESATLAPGGSRKGSIIFSVNRNDTDVRLVCTASTALPADALEIKL